VVCWDRLVGGCRHKKKMSSSRIRLRSRLVGTVYRRQNVADANTFAVPSRWDRLSSSKRRGREYVCGPASLGPFIVVKTSRTRYVCGPASLGPFIVVKNDTDAIRLRSRLVGTGHRGSVFFLRGKIGKSIK